MVKLAPIVLFCYNRPRLTEQTLVALSHNSLAAQSDLFVFCDGPKTNADEIQLNKIAEVRRIVKSKAWCGTVSVVESEHNKGLANSVIHGVSRIVEEYGKVIVLEDDLLTSKYFLEYMNIALDKYQDCDQVMQVSGHQFPIAISGNCDCGFVPFATSWGWATWSRSWVHFNAECTDASELMKDNVIREGFDVNGTYPFSQLLTKQLAGDKSVDSWAVRWWWRIFIMKGLTLFPCESMVSNIGFGADATHTTEENQTDQNFSLETRIVTFPASPIVDTQLWETIKGHFKSLSSPQLPSGKTPWWKRIFIGKN